MASRWNAGICPSSGSPDVHTGGAGNLAVTTEGRLIYLPNRSTPRRVRQIREWRLADVADVGVQERDWTPYTGGWQRRLRITLTNGDDLLFVMRNRDRAISQLRRLLTPATF